MDVSPTDNTSSQPSIKHRKLQKKPEQLPVQVTADNGHSPSLSSPKSLSRPASKLPQPSVTAGSHARALKTHIAGPSPAFTKDANKPRPIHGPPRSEGEVFKTTPKPRGPTQRNVSNADSGVVLSPVNSPLQTSPGTRRAESPADSAVGASPSTTSAVGPKRVEKTAKASPTVPTSQRKERQIPRPLGSSKGSSTRCDTMANPSGISYPVGRVHAWRPKSGSSSCYSLLRESTYPTPLAGSPLADTALDLRQTVHDGNISTDSSSSSLRRLLSRVSQKTSSPKRPDHFSAAKPPAPLDRDSTLEGYRPLPDEAIREAGEPPILVGAPVTPTVISYATTPVEALPGVRDDVSVQTANKKGGKTGGSSLWSLFRNRSKSSAGVKRSQHPWGLRRSSMTGDCSTHFSSSIHGVPNGCFDGDYSRKIGLHAESDRHQRGNGSWQSIRPRARQSSNDSWPSFDGTRPTQPAGPHTNKQLPPFPAPLTRPTLGRLPPNTRSESRESSTETDEENQIQRHRRRALFALDGVTYTGGSGCCRSFLPQTPTRKNDTHPAQHRRPPPPPPHPPRQQNHTHPPVPPEPPKAIVSSTDEAPTTNSSPPNRMSEEAKREFMKRGKETEARVAEHARTFEGAAAEGWRTRSTSLVSSASSDTGLEMKVNYRAPGHIDGSLESLGIIDAPIVSAHQADVAWWEAGDPTKQEDRPECDGKTGKTDKKAVLEHAVVELEHAATEAVVVDVEDAGANVGERSSTWPAQQQTQSARQALTGTAPPRPSQQRLRAEQESYLRGRQLTRETFRRHREGGRWEFTQQQRQHGSPLSASNAATKQQQEMITVNISHQKANGDSPPNSTLAAGNGNENGDSSTGSSSTSLRSTALRNGKPPRPFMNAYEAAHAVHSSPMSTLSQRSLGLSAEQMRLMRPEPLTLSLRGGRQNGDGCRIAEATKHGGSKPVAEKTAAPATVRRRSPPPPPPQPPQAPGVAVPAAVAPCTESVTPQHRRPLPPTPPPIPPKSGLRPHLVGDWSGAKMQGLKHDILRSSVAQRPNLHTVVEESARRASACSRSSGWTDVRATGNAVEDDDGGESRSETGSERFWSDDEGDGLGKNRAESKETTPEKVTAWDGCAVGRKRSGREHSDDENQVVDYYLNAQREEEQRANRRVVEEEAARKAAEQAELAREREDEARRLRVANLMARVRAGAMN